MQGRQHKWPRTAHGFSLVEMLVVILIASILLGVAATLCVTSGPVARRGAAEQFITCLDYARSEAMTKHITVLLALAEPADMAEDTRRLSVGIFQIPEKADATALDQAILLTRWQSFEEGIVMNSAGHPDRTSIADLAKYHLSYQTPSGVKTMLVTGILINPQGVIKYPNVTDHCYVYFAEGFYKGISSPTIKLHGAERLPTEISVRVNQNCRAYITD